MKIPARRIINNVTILFFDSLFDGRIIINSTLRAPVKKKPVALFSCVTHNIRIAGVVWMFSGVISVVKLLGID
jgi:hypothetical protein